MASEVSDKIDVDLNISEVRYQRTEFAAVVFHNVAETYPADAHIECQYTITKGLIPSTRDWIGLYKVGWMRVQDYVYYEWAPYPENYETGKEATGHVLYQSYRLPGDDGEFYQFCYVSNSGQVRGASMPFQFRQPHADDYVEIMDEESDMMVIRCKTAVLEETLKASENEKVEIMKVQKSLESERDGLVDKLCSLEEDLKKTRTRAKGLKKTLEKSEEKIVRLNQEAQDLNLVHDGLQAKVEKLEQGKITMQGRLEEVEKELKLSTAALKKLQSEKDELVGVIRNLKEEREMLKTHYTSNESTFKCQTTQIEQLQSELADSVKNIKSLRDECAQLQQQLTVEQQKGTEQSVRGQAQEESIQLLSHQLKNAEDKLEAAEENKNMLQQEMKTYEETQKKMSADLEEKHEKCDQLKQKLALTEESYLTETGQLKDVITELETQLSATEKKNQACESEIQLLRDQTTQQLNTSETALGSMYALKMADDKLKERFTKLQEEHNKVVGDNKKKQKQLRDNVLELEDLKERLRMAKEEYKVLYIEKQKWQKKVEKIVERRRSRSDGQSSSSDGVVKEKLQTGADLQDEGKKSLEASELRLQLQELGVELQTLQDSKKKYKQALQDDRARQETLRKHYHEDLQKKQRENEKLRKSREEVTSEYEMKIRALHNFIADKEKVIEDLNQKLRDNRLANEPKSPEKRHHSGGLKTSPQLSAIHTPPEPCFPLPPLKYPAHGPVTVTELVYPDLQEIAREVDDPLCEVDSLSEPLTPLPPPIQPIVLPSAKMAAVRAFLEPSAEEGDTIDMFLQTEVKTEIEEPVVVPSAPVLQTEERFLDAIGESMKMCPVCDQTFSADIPEKQFTLHVLGHAGRICPVCLKLVDEDVSSEQFAHHVNQHLSM
ncbi:hypothetical protein ScPMuIL_012814 [Solemya velum]